MNHSPVYIEIRQDSLHALRGASGLDFPLRRLENGRLDPESFAEIARRLNSFLPERRSAGVRTVYCAIPARGVSLRKLQMPAVPRPELERMLPLQIEAEFPLPPSELAWAWTPHSAEPSRLPAGSTTQEISVVAVRKDLLKDYAALFVQSGFNPVFTVAAWARLEQLRQQQNSFGWLDIGGGPAELMTVENGQPAALRVLPWSVQNLLQTARTRLQLSEAEAAQWVRGSISESGELTGQLDAIVASEMEALAQAIASVGAPATLFLTGFQGSLKSGAELLSRALGPQTSCQVAESGDTPGASVANMSLHQLHERGGPDALLVLRMALEETPAASRAPGAYRWAALACGLFILSLLFRYAEVWISKPRLERKIAEIRAYQSKQPRIDNELGFLQALKTNQLPCLDTLAIVANSAPPGARFDSFSMPRRGDISFRGSMGNAAQLTEFRTKLIDSGFFASVVVEEQTPTPDRQKITLRVTAQLRPAGERKALPAALLEIKPAEPPPPSAPSGGPRPMVADRRAG